jgi:hypothetical protein
MRECFAAANAVGWPDKIRACFLQTETPIFLTGNGPLDFQQASRSRPKRWHLSVFEPLTPDGTRTETDHLLHRFIPAAISYVRQPASVIKNPS